jgi:alkylglycerol monooxygenase
MKKKLLLTVIMFCMGNICVQAQNNLIPNSTFLGMESNALYNFSMGILIMFFLVLAEMIFSYVKKKKYYSFNETFSNVTCGILERSAFVLFAFVYYNYFDFIYNYSIFKIPVNIYSQIGLFFLVDLIWYVYHRMGHRVNILWAAHVTHHQSEDYNLSVSFRVSSLQLLIRMFFWAVLPFIGFNPGVTLLMIGINAAYQFFIHTQVVQNLGFLEHIFATPSNHRVHHGKNQVYIDKNYGGIFIIWDKIFGTYEPERETVKYGITTPINSTSPLKAWFEYYQNVLKTAFKIPRMKDKLKILFGPPELMSQYVKKDSNGNNPPISKKTDKFIHSFVIFQTLLSICFMIVLYIEYGKTVSHGIAFVIFVFQIFILDGLAKVVDAGKVNLNIEMIKLFGALVILFWVKHYYLLWICIFLILVSTYALARHIKTDSQEIEPLSSDNR